MNGLLITLQSRRKVLAVLVTAVITLVPVPLLQGASVSHPGWKTYTSQTFHVTLQYPAHWHQIEGYDGEKHGGEDGFFQLSAGSGGERTVEELCESAATHKRKPYGSSPQLERWQVQGQKACLIWPSEDQAEDMKGQAELAVQYSQPVQIREGVYHYFTLWADKQHVKEIAQTLQFAVPSESTYTGPDLRHPRRWILGVRRPAGSGPQETYTSPVFQVTLQHPAGWRHVEGYDERYGGADGFFQLSAASGEGKTLEEVCEWEAANLTYGFLPQIQWWQVQGQDACVIWPSEDQETIRRGQAALISRSPKPVQLKGNVCHYLILWADKYHIEEIGKTLHFVGASADPFTGPDLRHPKRLILKLRGEVAATEPAFNPETHALKYVDRPLCFSVDVPADWTSDGIPGAFAWFGFKKQKQPSFNITKGGGRLGMTPSLERALAEWRQGSLGPYIQEVRNFTVGDQPALWITAAPVVEEIRVVVLVIAPDCGEGPHDLSISARGPEWEQFETFLSHFRFLQPAS